MDANTFVIVLLSAGVLYALGALAGREEKKRLEIERRRIDAQMSQTMEDHRHPPDWGERRRYVLTRDKFMCAKCGSTESLHVHHIIPRKKHIDHSVINLITLCHRCHGKEHHLNFLTNDERELKSLLTQNAHLGRRIKSRKVHPCAYCKNTIIKGEYYIRIELKNCSYKIYRLLQNDHAKVCSICALSMAIKKDIPRKSGGGN